MHRLIHLKHLQLHPGHQEYELVIANFHSDFLSGFIFRALISKNPIPKYSIKCIILSYLHNCENQLRLFPGCAEKYNTNPT